ncbi:MAG: Kef-type transport system rane component-like protein [Streptosporangiaceae bacterium]|nr:Kef-type transport system rane component-like protein [Streptosporangiaceae bacterium]
MLRIDLLLLDLVVVLALARLLGAGAKLLGQPPVIGEILAGILLGPSLLGSSWLGSSWLGFSPGGELFPADVRPALKALADVGLVLFMFVVGMELDQKLVRGKGRVAAGVSLGSTLLPFALGCGVALWLADRHAPHGKTLAFVLFFGAAMSATAFPVLARILTDRGMQRTELGGLALASAAVIDVLAWTALAVVVALAGTAGNEQWHVALAVPYALVMLFAVRPLLRRLLPSYQRSGRLTPGLLALVLIGLFTSAWATEWMQIHFIFGAFLFGAVMPREGAERLGHEILERLEQLAVLLLLPMFFVVSGLAVDLTKLDLGAVGVLAVILVVAVAGKLAGAYAGARLTGVPHRRSAALATLINTRGLTEIVILTVGLQKGVLDNELFSLMVVMALVTTAMTGPLLRWIYPDRRIARDIAEAERVALGEPTVHRVVAVLPSVPSGRPLAALAAALATAHRPAEVVLGHLHPYPAGRLEMGLGLSSELAEMAGSLGTLESYAAEFGTADLPVRVVSRFAADLSAELPELVVAAQADLVVTPAGAPGYQRLRDGTTGRLVTVLSDDEPGLTVRVIAVPYDGGADATAAVQVALALARVRRGSLVLVGGKRAAALTAKLTEAGADVRVAADVPDGSLVVAPDAAGPPGKTAGMGSGNTPGTAPGTAPGMAPGVGPGTAPGVGPASADVLVRAEQDIADEVDWAAFLQSMTLSTTPSTPLFPTPSTTSTPTTESSPA